MRIALVINNYDATGGGAERWTDRHARQLLARGHQVHLIARRFNGAPESALTHPVEIPARSMRWPRLGFAEAAEKAAENLGVDVVHDMGDGWHCDLFMPHHGTRVGGFQRNTHLLRNSVRWTRPIAWRLLPRYREFAELERRQYSVCSGKRFIALSRMVAEHMQKHYAVPDSAIRIVPSGVDTQWFTPAPSARARSLVRRKLGMDAAVIFLIVAHNFRLKGVDELLQATAKLKPHVPVGVVVAGAGAVKRYSQLARKLGVQGAVKFVGNWPDPRPLYRAADVYVQPTYYDPCSLVALEAIASGLPIITTRYNGASELICEGEHGFIMNEPNDIAGLVEAMRSLLDSQLRQRMTAAACKLSTQCTERRNVDTIEALYFENCAHRAAA